MPASSARSPSQSRGIGKAIVEALGQRSDVKTVLALSRAGTDLGLDASRARIVYRKLDVTSQFDVDRFAEELDSVDVLIANSGQNLNNERLSMAEKAERTLAVNYYGVKRIVNATLPHMQPGARIVNMSSVASHLRGYSAPIEQRFRAAQTVEDVDRIAQDYLEAAKSGEPKGWSNPCPSSRSRTADPRRLGLEGARQRLHGSRRARGRRHRGQLLLSGLGQD